LPKHSFIGMNTSKNDTLFSQNLAVIRKKRGFSQDELAKKVGTIAITIGRYERGEIKPSIEIAMKIAEALEVSLDYLVGSSDAVLEKSLVQKILAIQQLPDEQKNIVVSLMDAYLRDFQAKKTYAQ
jgi:transcriptional regulator with XRE-family HTH domain